MATVEQDDRLASVPSPRERAAVGTDPGAQGKTRQATLPTQLSAPAVESIESQTTPSAPSPAETAGPFAPAPSPHPTRRHHLLRIIATGTVAVVLVGTVLLTRADAEARSEQTRAQAQAAAAGLANGAFEDSEEEAPAVIEEFYAEAATQSPATSVAARHAVANHAAGEPREAGNRLSLADKLHAKAEAQEAPALAVT